MLLRPVGRPESVTPGAQPHTLFRLGRTELVYDIYLNPPVLARANGDSLHEELDKFAALQERLFCVLFECLEAIAQRRQPECSVLLRYVVLLSMSDVCLDCFHEELQVGDAILRVGYVDLELIFIEVALCVELHILALLRLGLC